jgi:uroporphyrinogen III methyltransferase/synthase
MNEPLVYLVGAGPGNPGLLTLRALEVLRRANVVIYDKLVSVVLLEHAPPSAERVCVTELGPCHAQRLTPITERMIAAARDGKRVVRLKGGDPYVFGRGGEEAEALSQAGIPFEVVPGVTAALGTAAYAGIPLTHRAVSSAVAFVTGHENPEKPETTIDWSALARFPGTLVFYMGIARLERIARALVANGLSPDTPSAAVHSATTGQQQTVTAPLAALPAQVRAEGLTSPGLVIVGQVVHMRESMTWFERRPLFGKRVLVTRPRHQAGPLAERLTELGALPYLLPTVEVRPPADWGPVDRALRELGHYAWVVFTSANGVAAFVDRLEAIGLDLRALGGAKVAAIGPKTAEALRQRHLTPDLVPARYQSEDLAAALAPHIQPGQRVLLARADRGREVLREQLATLCEVEQVAVYSQVDAVELSEDVLDHFRRGEIDYVTLTSANVARSLLGRLDETCRARITAGAVRLVTISAVTSAEVARLGLPVAAEAKEATVEGLIQAMIGLCGPLAPKAEDVKLTRGGG